ncbi:MAG: glutaminyl-peptide cyclotransferase [Flavobacteriales bacterium]|jgi:glutaminyl-peptide cyclotransferase|nr:glutaminyl-peptide cyclotransferase [Flavobacteriales bacterium]
MKKNTFFTALLAILTLTISCDDQGAKKKKFGWKTVVKKQYLKQGESPEIKLINIGEPFDSLQVFYIGKRVEITKNGEFYTLQNNNNKVGNRVFDIKIFANGRKFSKKQNFFIYSKTAPKKRNYKVVNRYPHNATSFTQGLEFYGDKLIEGTGQYGESKLMEIDLKTGKATQSIDLAKSKFGEGITILNDKIYQLTWKAGHGFVYDTSFKLLNTFPYGKSKEGWGLCNDGKFLYKSDGSSTIYKIDPKNFREIEEIPVATHQAFPNMINELEWINGRIYANIYLQNYIVVINPKTGEVEQFIDFTDLAKENISEREQALNGIAFHKEKNELYITGKNWKYLYHIEIE